MEKKLLSGLTALIVAAQGFGVPVLAAAPAEVIGAARDIDKVIVSFDKDPGDIGAAVLASDMKDTGIVAEKDTDKLVISTDELAAGTYYLRVDAAKTKLYEFKINEMPGNWVTDSTAGSGKAVYHDSDNPDWIFMTGDENNIKTYTWTDTDGAEHSTKYSDTAAFLHDKNYAEYSYADADVEFDYKCTNTSDKALRNYGGMKIFLNASQNTGSVNQWATFIQSATGAYMISLGSQSNINLGVRLLKWDGQPDRKTTYGDGLQIGSELETEDGGATPLSDVINLSNYAPNKEYRFKAKTRIVAEGVNISFYAAEYTEDESGNKVLGDYSEVFSITDTDSPITDGTAYLLSMNGDGNAFLNSHLVKDIRIGNTVLEEIPVESLAVDKISATGDITIDFSNPVNAQTLDNIKVMTVGENPMEMSWITKTVDKDDPSLIKINLGDGLMPSDNGYYLQIGKGVTSEFGVQLDRQYDYIFTRDEFADEITADSDGRNSNWKVMTWDPIINSYVYDGGLFVSGSNPATSTAETKAGVTVPMNAQVGVLYNNDYQNISYGDSSLVFDYKSYSDKATWGNDNYEGTSVYFNGKDFQRAGKSENITSSSGAYVLTIGYYGAQVKLSKWDGAQKAMAPHIREVTNELASAALSNYTTGDTVRYKIDTENTDEGIVIDVYTAKVTDGEPGKFEKLLSYTDTDADRKTEGSFWFAASKSMTVYNYVNSTVIDNISYSSVSLTDLSKEAESIKNRIDTVYNSDNWDIYAEEIQSIKAAYDAYVSIVGGFDEDYAAKLNKLLTGKTNEEISRDCFAKLAKKDSLKIVFIGGSLTEGGAAYQEIFKNYIAEKSGVSADNITVINVGNGGQGSAWHQVRLYDEVMAENPDMVIIDYSGNDELYYAESNSMADGVQKAALAAEVTIRRLMNMENQPVIAFNVIPNKARIINKHLLNSGITHYLSNSNPKAIDYPTFMYTESVFKYYNVPVFDILDEMVKYTSISDIETAYYTPVKTDTTWSYTTDSTDGTFKTVTTPISDIELYVDFDAINTHFGKEYSFNTEEYGNTFNAVAKDSTHPSAGYDGYKLYGDIMRELMENDTRAALRYATRPSEPIVKNAEIYEKFNMTKTPLSVASLEESENMRVSGEYYDETGFLSLNGRKVDGVTFEGPATFEYDFAGHVFYAVADSKEKLLKYATIDGAAYYSTARYYNNTMLSDSENHTFKVVLPAGEKISISGFYTDEDVLLNNFEKDGKYTEVDLTSAANTYGAYKTGDGTVYSQEHDKYRLGEMPDMLIYYKEDGYIYSSPNADEMYAHFNSADYTGTPFNLEQLKNKRFRAITAESELTKNRKNIWSDASLIEDANLEAAIPSVDVPNDIYTKLHLLIASNGGDYSAKVRVNYTDGTSDVIDYTIYKYNNDVSADSKVQRVFEGYELSNMGGNTSGRKYYLNEYTLDIPSQKRVDSISFTDKNNYRIYGITLEKTYESGLYDVTFKKGAKAVTDLAKHKGETLDVALKVEKETKGTVILAIRSNDRLVSVKSIDVNTVNSADYINIIEDTLDIPSEYGEGYSINAYLWNGTAGIKPLTVKIEK